RKAARGVADIDASRRCVTAEVHRSEVPARHEQQGGKRERTRTDGHYTRFAGKAKEFRCGRPTGQLVSWQDNVTHVPTPPPFTEEAARRGARVGARRRIRV